MKIATRDFRNYVQSERALCRMTYTQMIAYTEFVSRHWRYVTDTPRERSRNVTCTWYIRRLNKICLRPRRIEILIDTLAIRRWYANMWQRYKNLYILLACKSLAIVLRINKYGVAKLSYDIRASVARVKVSCVATSHQSHFAKEILSFKNVYRSRRKVIANMSRIPRITMSPRNFDEFTMMR